MTRHEAVFGTKIAEQMVTRPGGATMDEVIAATGGPQYNVLRKLEARGYRICKVKEGRATRYFADPPDALIYEATLTRQGQVTIPKEVRARLRLRGGQKVRFIVHEDGRVEIAPVSNRLSDLFGILGKPPRSATLKEMDEAIAQGAVKRFLRSKR
jgi:AbrB family looped-hinge helix DNA binding protein